LRSDRDHCASRVAVEQEEEERRREEEERRRGDEEQATDIKSNNPHLAGGEKTFNSNKNPTTVQQKSHKFTKIT